MTPEQVIGIKLGTHLGNIAITLLRIWVTRKQYKNLYGIICNIFLVMTFSADLCGSSLITSIMVRERHSLDKAGGDTKLVDPEIGLAINARAIFFAHLCYYIALFALKGAYLAFYALILQRIEGKKRLALYIGGFVWLTGLIAGFLIHLLWCRPITDNWNLQNLNPSCPTIMNYHAFTAMAVINVITDMAILIIPILIVSSLNLHHTEKWGLFIVFCIGSISIVASVVRFVLVGDRINAKAMTFETLHVYAVCSHAEVFFGLFAIALPVFRLHLQRIVKALSHASSKYLKSSQNSSSPGHHHQNEAGHIELGDSDQPSANNSTKNLHTATLATIDYPAAIRGVFSK